MLLQHPIPMGMRAMRRIRSVIITWGLRSGPVICTYALVSVPILALIPAGTWGHITGTLQLIPRWPVVPVTLIPPSPRLTVTIPLERISHQWLQWFLRFPSDVLQASVRILWELWHIFSWYLSQIKCGTEAAFKKSCRNLSSFIHMTTSTRHECQMMPTSANIYQISPVHRLCWYQPWCSLLTKPEW